MSFTPYVASLHAYHTLGFRDFMPRGTHSAFTCPSVCCVLHPGYKSGRVCLLHLKLPCVQEERAEDGLQDVHVKNNTSQKDSN